jgi:hypothetical protein
MYRLCDRVKKLVPGSNKPYYKTALDAVIATVVSIMVTFMILLVWAIWNGTDGIAMALAQAAVGAFILQFVYEYLGVNAMIYESSARYMRGRIENKFSTVTSAKCYLEYNNLRDKILAQRNTDNGIGDGSSGTDAEAKLDANLDVLETILKPSLVRELIDGFPTKPAKMTTKEYTDIMVACSHDKEKCRQLSKLIDEFDENTIRWLLINGFHDLPDIPTVHKLADQAAHAYYAEELKKDDDYVIANYGSRAKLTKLLTPN